jgi:hypothetical protein
MQFILLFLDQYEPLFYLILAFFGMFVFRRLWQAWREWRNSYFGLERELAVRRMAQWSAASILIFVLACAIFVLGSFILPGLPASAFVSTPTMNLLATPLGDVTSGASALETPPVPLATIPGSEGCVPGKLEIASPKPGEAVSGRIEIVGTVSIESMGFYKYEFAPLGSDIWATISADRKPKVKEQLGFWATGALTPGDYRLRLVVTDTAGNALPACIITVRVVGQ